MSQPIDPTAAALRLIIERMHKHVGDRVYDLRHEAEALLPLASLGALEPAETTYSFTIHASNEDAAAWVTHASEADLTGTLATARDLARDFGSRITLRDAAGFVRGAVEPSGNYTLT